MKDIIKENAFTFPMDILPIYCLTPKKTKNFQIKHYTPLF